MSDEKEPDGFSEQTGAFRPTSKPIRPRMSRPVDAEQPLQDQVSRFIATYGVYLCAVAILVLSKITLYWYIPAMIIIVAARLWADRATTHDA